MTNEELNKQAQKECCSAETTAHHGGENGKSFWNAEAFQFMYVPSFQFQPISGCRKYRFSAKDENGNIHSFDAEKPSALLTDIWGEIPEGVVELTVRTVNDDNSEGYLVGARTFFKLAPFSTDLPEAKCTYKECASRAYDYIMELDFIRYYILINGAQVYDAQEDKVLVSADISNDLAISLMDHAEEIGAYYDCYKDNRGVMNQAMYDYLDPVMPDANYRAYMRSVRTPVADLRTYLRTDGGNVQKVQYFFSDLSERAHQLEVLNGLFPGIKATSSLSTNIEINSVDAGKGPALEKLCACLGFSAENAMAFGDGTNDLDMLIAAGVGVAMSNSDTKLFPHADLITLCDNNSAGVGKAIFDYLRG